MRVLCGVLRIVGLVVLTAAVWFSFVAQVFVFQFLTYHPGIGWRLGCVDRFSKTA